MTRLHFDLPGDAGLRESPHPGQLTHYDAAVVADLPGGPVTLAAEVWTVSPTPAA